MVRNVKPQSNVGNIILLIVIVIMIMGAFASMTSFVLYRAKTRSTIDKINYEKDQKQFFIDKNQDYFKHDLVIQELFTGESATSVDLKPLKDYIAAKQKQYSIQPADTATLEVILQVVKEEIKRQELAYSEIETHNKISDGRRQEVQKRDKDLVSNYSEIINKIREEDIRNADDIIDVRDSFYKALGAKMDEDIANIETQVLAVQTKYEKLLKDVKIDIRQKEDMIKQNAVQKDPVTTLMGMNGEISNPSRSSTSAYINLGTDDNVQMGCKFGVFNELPGGVIKWRGEVEVKNVLEPHLSEVSITQLLNAYEPLVNGDLLWNPFFDPKRQKVVVFVGKFEEQNYLYFKYSQEEIKRRLALLNVKMEDKVTGLTDFVIKGVKRDGDEGDDENLYMATILTIPQISITDLIKYIEY